MDKQLVLLDFDGTLTRKDTLLEFIRFYHGWPLFLGGFLLLSPVLVAMKLKLIPNYRAKEMVLKFFFGNVPLDVFDKRCLEFATSVIPGLLRPSAPALLTKMTSENSTIVVVSASPENWVRPWCESQAIQCLATRLQVSDQNISGNIDGKNCYGAEKVERIKNAFHLEQYGKIIAYGDSRGDREMLALAHEPHYRAL